ncbi:hypothetical protein EMIT0210MI2_12318 [Priestia megaterium]
MIFTRNLTSMLMNARRVYKELLEMVLNDNICKKLEQSKRELLAE